MKTKAILIAFVFLPLAAVNAGWLDFLTPKSATGVTSVVTAPVGALTQDEIVRGLKEALAKGTSAAVANLGKDGGFLTNLDVRIPMPQSLQTVEKTLRKLKQDKLADEFVATMNHAAEQAVPLAAGVFVNSITNMTVADAQAILTGPNDAATQYFRKISETNLHTKFLPIVKEATAKAGVTAAYKKLMKQAGPVAQFLGTDAGDIDNYVTQKSLDGLFKMIAAEEAKIRANPVARTTDLLKKVFGSATK